MLEKSLDLVQKMQEIIDSYNTRMTVRQLYYQLVSRHVIENNLKSYKRMDHILTKARKENLIDPLALVDRSKPLLKDSSWNSMTSFWKTVGKSYKRSVWQDQKEYVEVWIEKDALAGVISPVTNKYDCFLAIGRGYQSMTNKAEAVNRFEGEEEGTILYLGDFDPTGLDIPRDLEDQLEKMGASVEVERVALTLEQINEYSLPPIMTKKTDSRTVAHIAQYGDIAVELDALPPDTLISIVEGAINKHIDWEKYEVTLEREKEDKTKITQIMEGLQ
jgi:hypothetical protein